MEKIRNAVDGLKESDALLAITTSKMVVEDQKYYASKLGLIAAEEADTVSTIANTAAKTANLSIINMLKVAWAKLVAFMNTNPYIAVLTGITATIGAVSVTIDALTTSTEEAKETAEKSAQKLSDLQSEITTINSELENTSQKIDEILAKDKIELTDLEALKKLQKQNDELERELRIKEALEKHTKKEASDDATKVFTSIPDNGTWQVRGTTVFYEETRGAGGIGQYQDVDRDRMQASIDYMNQITELNTEINSLQKEQDKYTVGSNEFNLIQNRIDSKIKVINAVQEALDTYIEEFQSEDDNLVAGLSEDTDNVLSTLDDIYSKYDVLMNYTNGTAITLTERLQNRFAHGADMSDGSTYNATSDIDKQISSWISTLDDEDKKILLKCELEETSLDDLKQYITEQKDDTEDAFDSISISKTVDKIDNELNPSLKALASAYQNIFTSDGFTKANINNDMLASIKSEIERITSSYELN